MTAIAPASSYSARGAVGVGGLFGDGLLEGRFAASRRCMRRSSRSWSGESVESLVTSVASLYATSRYCGLMVSPGPAKHTSVSMYFSPDASVIFLDILNKPYEQVMPSQMCVPSAALSHLVKASGGSSSVHHSLLSSCVLTPNHTSGSQRSYMMRMKRCCAAFADHSACETRAGGSGGTHDREPS